MLACQAGALWLVRSAMEDAAVGLAAVTLLLLAYGLLAHTPLLRRLLGLFVRPSPLSSLRPVLCAQSSRAAACPLRACGCVCASSQHRERTSPFARAS